ncbi:MAG TPA: hypothetical protein VNM87_13150 [Candidatus Udaeobacter sp.]|nr:hypothetical protein [Candidatus Udaeobacter sp.]
MALGAWSAVAGGGEGSPPASAAPPAPAPAAARPLDPGTFVDHDAYPPIPEPAPSESDLIRFYVRDGLVRPFADALDLPGALIDLAGDAQQAPANVNRFDEVPNTSWFTNRNHFRAVPVEEILIGPGHCKHPEPPWTIKSIKKGGVNPGFQIKDATGTRWVVKLDPPGYPQIGSGAEVIVSRLLWAAGYNVPHDAAVTFVRDELVLDPELEQGKDGEPPFTKADLDRLLAKGCRAVDGRYYALASLFLPGKPLGNTRIAKPRPDDPNDWYTHRRRMELRGLRILAAWLNHWDTKEQQTLDMFETRSDADSLGYVAHYMIDVGATLGAAAEGPKRLKTCYEFAIDPGWIGRRFASLGFVTEPWRRAQQETQIPSVGNFQAEGFDPDDFRPILPHLAFQECTAREGYWGAKLVASFSDAQIRAAVEAAGYEDPRATAYVIDALQKRRDVIVRTWFGRVAPLDFFQVAGGELRFHDLAIDRGLTGPRRYAVRVDPLPDPEGKSADLAADPFEIDHPRIDLSRFERGLGAVRLTIGIVGEKARAVQVEIERSGNGWQITQVRHG